MRSSIFVSLFKFPLYTINIITQSCETICYLRFWIRIVPWALKGTFVIIWVFKFSHRRINPSLCFLITFKILSFLLLPYNGYICIKWDFEILVPIDKSLSIHYKFASIETENEADLGRITLFTNLKYGNSFFNMQSLKENQSSHLLSKEMPRGTYECRH